MKGHIGPVIGLAAVLVALGQVNVTAAAPAVHRIVISTMAFGPSPSDMHAGDIIEWVNHDIFQHSATADDKNFDVDIAPDATARVVVQKAGTIRYICKYHPSMRSQLVVMPASTGR